MQYFVLIRKLSWDFQDRCGYGLLHGGTVRTEVVRLAEPSSALKILKYRLRKTSIRLQGPLNALSILQVILQIYKALNLNNCVLALHRHSAGMLEVR